MSERFVTCATMQWSRCLSVVLRRLDIAISRPHYVCEYLFIYLYLIFHSSLHHNHHSHNTCVLVENYVKLIKWVAHNLHIPIHVFAHSQFIFAHQLVRMQLYTLISDHPSSYLLNYAHSRLRRMARGSGSQFISYQLCFHASTSGSLNRILHPGPEGPLLASEQWSSPQSIQVWSHCFFQLQGPNLSKPLAESIKSI